MHSCGLGEGGCDPCCGEKEGASGGPWNINHEDPFPPRAYHKPIAASSASWPTASTSSSRPGSCSPSSAGASVRGQTRYGIHGVHPYRIDRPRFHTHTHTHTFHFTNTKTYSPVDPRRGDVLPRRQAGRVLEPALGRVRLAARSGAHQGTFAPSRMVDNKPWVARMCGLLTFHFVGDLIGKTGQGQGGAGQIRRQGRVSHA